ncbi:MAG: DUF86 domain-containing protein [Euryarchaeota archaeon]|nr:DUF86 domain-containing protein [Euryarchaeota archaeon]MBU4222293.1 DUF86 domain-containing protein [Euryarchaeota archaeon]MBU4340484.1 DUF86 domain-containing protein [Euryarchaeota archaeon]MCG2735419.1 DUF86 domain-containing protein [Candidatus Methanoperedenaceae archaeon]
MQRDKEYMLDILEAAKLAIQYIDEKTREEFFSNTQYQDAVIRRIEIIGEAARRISEETQAAYPEIPWSDLISMRNVMIHEYDDIDIWIVWETVKNDLPLLVDSLENILGTT